MYKKFTLAELTSIQNNFISHLYKIIQQEKCQGINDFCKFAFKEGNELFYFDRGEVVFKIVLENNKLHFFDEKEKIEVEVPADQKGGLQDMIKSFIIHKGRQTGHTIKEILRAEFSKGTFAKMLDKPYLVYDIETSLIPDDKNLKNVEFYIGYYMEEKESWKAEYVCITQENLAQFVDKMLNFDGYIVGFNQIYFDNPVSVYNVNMDAVATAEAIKTLNEKSIDLYLFVRTLTGRRNLGLNRLATDLVGESKNLEWGGASVENLWKERKSTWNEKLLETLKSYCENDVVMTTLLFFYLLHFKKIYLDGEEYLYDIPKFLAYAKPFEAKVDPNKMHGQSLLS